MTYLVWSAERAKSLKSLKRVIRAIYANDNCVAIDGRIHSKVDFSLVVKIRRTTLETLVFLEYIRVVDTVIHLTPKAVVMLTKEEQIKWMNKYVVV